MAQYTTLKQAITDRVYSNGQMAITGPKLQEALLAMVDSLASGYIFKGVANASTNPGTPDEDVFYLATESGTYTNFGSAVIPNGLTIIRNNASGWQAVTLLSIDSTPTESSVNLLTSGGAYAAIALKQDALTFDSAPTNGSNNPVVSGGVYTAIQQAIAAIVAGTTEIYDISANNSGASYATLTAALALVPSVLQKGGMSVKYIDSTTSKYVQYRLTATSWSTTESDWEESGTAKLYTTTGQNTDGAMTQQAITNAVNAAIEAANGALQESDIELVPSKNLFDNTQLISGFIKTNGTILEASGTREGCKYAKIEVEGGKTYTLSFVNTAGSVSNDLKGFIYRDSNNTNITPSSNYNTYNVEGADTTSTRTGLSICRKFTMPANTKYFLVNVVYYSSGVLGLNATDSMQFEEGTTGTDYVSAEPGDVVSILGKSILSESVSYNGTIPNSSDIKEAVETTYTKASEAYTATQDAVKESDMTLITGKNLFNPQDAVSGFIKSSGEIKDGTSGTYLGSLYTKIPVEGGKTYCLSRTNIGSAGTDQINAYNGYIIKAADNSTVANGVLQTGWTVIETHKKFRLTMPANAAYLLVNYQSYSSGTLMIDYSGSLQLEEGTEVTGYEAFVQYIEKINGYGFANSEEAGTFLANYETSHKLKNLNIALIGDSITAMSTGWTTQLTRRGIGKSIVNKALSGARWSSTASESADNHLLWHQVSELVSQVNNNTYPTPDIIMMMAGGNDLNFDVGDPMSVFGTNNIFNQYAQTDTFNVTEGIRLACECALNAFPNIKIVLMTPISGLKRWETSTAKTKWMSICDAVKLSARLLSCKCFDVGGECGIYGYYELESPYKYTTDGTHPNTTGARILGNYIIDKLIETFKNTEDW